MGCSCEVTDFTGLENAILQLRNTNREIPETIAYLRWRYTQTPGAPAARIFWLLSPARERIGMAGVIFRPYWVGPARTPVAVIGDISLAEPWRHRGLGTWLLATMTTQLHEQFPASPALVIPTDSARHSLERSGWVTGGSLAPAVYILDATRYLGRGPVSRSLSAVTRGLSGWWLRRWMPRGAELHITTSAEQALQSLTVPPPGADCVMRELTVQQLRWRYEEHPRTSFEFACLRSGGATRAFLVFEQATLKESAGIYDLWALTGTDLRALLSLFLQWALAQGTLASVRILLAGQHPARRVLRGMGFISRPDGAVFQLSASDPRLTHLTWWLTQGDKDT